MSLPDPVFLSHIFHSEFLLLLSSSSSSSFPILPPFTPSVDLNNPMDHLLQLVLTAYTSNDTELRKQAEAELKERENQDFAAHMKNIFNIIFHQPNATHDKNTSFNTQTDQNGEKLIIYAAGLLRRTMNYEILNSFEELVRIVARNIACLYLEGITAGKKVKLAVALEYLMGFCASGNLAGKKIAYFFAYDF